MSQAINTRQAVGGMLINGQQIHDQKWATRSLPVGVLANTTDFFSAPASADPCVDRYSSGGNLVDSAKKFIVVQMGLWLYSANTAALADLDKIINFCAIRLSTNQREFGTFRALQLPAGGGLDVPGGQISITPGASGVAAASGVVGASNGLKTRGAMFKLAAPMIIGANQSFKAELLAPAVGSLFGAITLTQIVFAQLLLDGVEERAAS